MKPTRRGGSHSDQAREGSELGPITKPMDKAPSDYLANETVPEDPFCEEPLNESMENPGDRSKRFM